MTGREHRVRQMRAGRGDSRKPSVTRGSWKPACAGCWKEDLKNADAPSINLPMAGCPNPQNGRGQFCHIHFAKSTAEQNRIRYASSPVRQFEASRTWRNASTKVRADNPICQHILADGNQCSRPSVLVHHIIPPERAWHLRLDRHNLVALCDACHPRTNGEDRERYTPTKVNILGTTAEYPHHGRAQAPPDTPTPIQTPMSTGAGAQPSSVLDAALGDVASLLDGI